MMWQLQMVTNIGTHLHTSIYLQRENVPGFQFRGKESITFRVCRGGMLYYAIRCSFASSKVEPTCIRDRSTVPRTYEFNVYPAPLDGPRNLSATQKGHFSGDAPILAIDTMPTSLPLSQLSNSCQNGILPERRRLPAAYSMEDGDRETLIHALSMGFRSASALESPERPRRPYAVRNREHRQEMVALLDAALNVLVDTDLSTLSRDASVESTGHEQWRTFLAYSVCLKMSRGGNLFCQHYVCELYGIWRSLDLSFHISIALSMHPNDFTVYIIIIIYIETWFFRKNSFASPCIRHRSNRNLKGVDNLNITSSSKEGIEPGITRRGCCCDTTCRISCPHIAFATLGANVWFDESRKADLCLQHTN